MTQTYLNIPVSVCIYAIRQQCIEEAQLFTWLKLNCNHRFCLTNQISFRAIREIGITKETLQKRLKWLLVKKWISYNSKSETYHVNSFQIIHRKTNSPISKGVLWENYDIRKFKGFACAGIIGYYAKRKHYNDTHEIRLRDKGHKQVRIKKARPKMSLAPVSFNLPLEYLAKAIDLPKSTIQKMKSIARQNFFIEVENNFAESNLSVSELHQLRRFSKHAIELKKFTLTGGRVVEQLPDKIFLDINFRNKRKLKQTEPTNRYRK
ncbi:MAG: hypothetical protein AB7U05_06050 [Mangrovibacterium sp.]